MLTLKLFCSSHIESSVVESFSNGFSSIRGGTHPLIERDFLPPASSLPLFLQFRFMYA